MEPAMAFEKDWKSLDRRRGLKLMGSRTGFSTGK